MTFLIVTHVRHRRHNGKVYAYGPYVREMNLWFKHIDKALIVAPIEDEEPDPIDLPYETETLHFFPVPSFNLTTPGEMAKTVFKLPAITLQIMRGMQQADHIHLRCPGNMGLLGSIVQIAFPKKPKTAKYAGNWDPNSPQPWSYRLQKKILSNTFLTRNMKVLVYGEWPDQSSNIVPFFTASYSEIELVSGNLSLVSSRSSLVAEDPTKAQSQKTKDQKLKTKAQSQKTKAQSPKTKDQKPKTINLIFVGALSPGKQPLLSIQAAECLHNEGYEVHLDLFGEGVERPKLEAYIKENGLEDFVVLHGNQDADTVKRYYQKAHFLIFVSKSEGWPKVVAEAMFWGCLPITSDVSCVNYMIGEGSRGSIAEPNVDDIVNKIKYYLEDPETMVTQSQNAMRWSRQFTLEKFEEAVGDLLHEQ